MAAWRGTANFEHGLIPPGVAFEFWGRGAVFGLAHISPAQIYRFATKNVPEGGNDGSLGPKQALLKMFRGWCEPIEALIEATDDEAIRRDDIYDREPSKTWSKGRITLAGDAAHPMTPNLGQGACRAIEDAVALADCLGASQGPIASLRAYEERRTDRANGMVRKSRFMARVNQLENPSACRLRDLAVKTVPASLKLRQLERILGHQG